MEIKNISKKIFRTTPSKVENSSNHTNPFGVNFKGNMINADVFEPAFCGTKETIAQKAANKGKLWAAAMIASMNPIKTFGSRIKSSIVNAWDVANRTEINILPSVKNAIERIRHNITDGREYSARALDLKGTDGQEIMLQNIIAIRALEV